ERPFDLLAGGREPLPARHRTLCAAIDWSHRLLTPDIQRFFATLSIFRGGWALEAAEAVAGGGGGRGGAGDARGTGPPPPPHAPLSLCPGCAPAALRGFLRPGGRDVRRRDALPDAGAAAPVCGGAAGGGGTGGVARATCRLLPRAGPRCLRRLVSPRRRRLGA